MNTSNKLVPLSTGSTKKIIYGAWLFWILMMWSCDESAKNSFASENEWLDQNSDTLFVDPLILATKVDLDSTIGKSFIAITNQFCRINNGHNELRLEYDDKLESNFVIICSPEIINLDWTTIHTSSIKWNFRGNIIICKVSSHSNSQWITTYFSKLLFNGESVDGDGSNKVVNKINNEMLEVIKQSMSPKHKQPDKIQQIT